MNKQSLSFMQLTLLGLDAAMLNVVFFFSRLLFGQRIPDNYGDSYSEYLLLINAVWLLSAWFAGLYRRDVVINFESFSKKTVVTYLTWIALVIAYMFFFRELSVSRLFIGSTIVCLGGGLLLNRCVHVGIKRYSRKWFQSGKNIMIIGYNDTSRKLVSYLEEESIDSGILGFTENENKITELSHYPIMGSISESIEISKRHNVDRIFSTITPEQDPQLYRIMQEAENECIRFKIVPDLSMFVKGRYHVSYYNDIPMLTLQGEALDNMGNRIKKRVLDIVVSTLVIVFILSWLIPLISILIMLESRGPVFFSQWRTGKNRQKFRCYKFRSMYVNDNSDKIQATRHDSRITKVGRFLRRTSLDEFPQFFNVFIGNMSIVGPRPHMLQHTDDYSKLVDQFMVRHFLKPGITGWAQVNGYRGEISEPSHIKKRVEYDIWYMENWSLIQDIKIIFLTVFNVLKGEEKAY